LAHDLLPGDSIEWFYKLGGRVRKEAKVYSRRMNRWVPLEQLSLVIAVNDEEITWLSTTGCYAACYEDILYYADDYDVTMVIIPKKCVR